MKKEFEKIKAKFIVDSKTDLCKEILEILVVNKARMIKDGSTKHAGNFEKLSKKKRESIYEIMDVVWETIENNNNQLMMIHLIELKRFEEILQTKEGTD